MFLANIITALCKSLKVIKINDEAIKKLNNENKNYILAFWHGTMLLPWYLHGKPNCAALISKSKDGAQPCATSGGEPDHAAATVSQIIEELPTRKSLLALNDHGPLLASRRCEKGCSSRARSECDGRPK